MIHFGLKNCDILNVFLYFWGLLSLTVITCVWVYEKCRDSKLCMLLCSKIILSIQQNDFVSDVFEQKFESNATSLPNSQPVLICKESDVLISNCVWLNDFFKLWRRKRSLQVTKWINTWIGSLNEYLLSTKFLINRVEIMQVLSDSTVPQIVSICGTDEITPDDSLYHLKATIRQEMLYLKTRSNHKNHTVLLAGIQGQLLVSISLGVTGSISASVKFVSQPDIATISCSSCNSTSSGCRIHEEFDQIINALTHACTHLFFDYSTAENQLSSTPLPTNILTTPSNQTMHNSPAVPLRKMSTQLVNPITSSVLRSRCILLKIIKATGLCQETLPQIKTATVHGSRGVFVLIKVDEPFQQHTTSVCAIGRDNPFWDQHFILEISDKTKSLSIELFDRKGKNNDIFLGQVRLLTADISSASTRMMVPLRGEKECKDEILGLLTFEMLLMEPSSGQPALSKFNISPPVKDQENGAALESELETFMVSPLRLDNSQTTNNSSASSNVGYKTIISDSSSRQPEVHKCLQVNSDPDHIASECPQISANHQKPNLSLAPLHSVNLRRSVSSVASNGSFSNFNNYSRRANSAERVTIKSSINDNVYQTNERSHSQLDIDNIKSQELTDRRLGKNRSLSSSFRRLFKGRHRKKNESDSNSSFNHEPSYGNLTFSPASGSVSLQSQQMISGYKPSKSYRPQLTASQPSQNQMQKSDVGERIETML